MASRRLRVDRTIAQLLAAKRDLWDRARFQHADWPWSTCLRRIDKAEAASSPQSRNYLIDLMARCETGKNRMKAMLPSVGHPRRAQDRHAERLRERRRLHHLAERPAGRGGDVRSRRHRPPADDRGGSPRDLRRLHKPSSSGRLQHAARHQRRNRRAPPHRRAREDRPLSGGRTGRALSEADHLADEAHRTAGQAAATCPPRLPATVISVLLDEKGKALSSMELAKKLEHGATAARARRAS